MIQENKGIEEQDILLKLWQNQKKPLGKPLISFKNEDEKWVDSLEQGSTNKLMFLLLIFLLIIPYFVFEHQMLISLTQDSITNLRSEGIPEDLLMKLSSYIGKVWRGHDKLIADIESVTEVRKYQDMIFKHTEYKEIVGTAIPYPISFLLFIFVSIATIIMFTTRLVPSILIRIFCGNKFLVVRVKEGELKSRLREQYEKDRPRNVLFNIRRYSFRTWRLLVFFSPFDFKFIWWWALIIGVITTEMEYIGHMRANIEYHMETEYLNELGISLMEALIFAIIAYIATNVLGELLNFSRRFSIFDRVIKDAEKLSDKMDDVTPIAAETKQVLKTSVFVLGTGSEMQKFSNELLLVEDKRIAQQSREFLINTANQTKNFLYQVNKGADSRHINLWLLCTLNQYMKSEGEILNTTQRRIITRYSNLGKMASQLVNSTFPGTDQLSLEESNRIKFFGLVAIPANRFLNKKLEPILEETGEVIGTVGDEDWESYLESNIIASMRGIIQKRYFLSIRGKQEELRSISEEAHALHITDVKGQLKRYVELTNAEENLRIAGKLPKIAKKKRKLLHGKEIYRYNIDSTNRGEGDWDTLGNVIGKIYHRKNCCFIREIRKKDFEDFFIRKHKPLDYFAIQVGGKWEFCLEALYDSTFDVAEIQIFHDEVKDESRKDWEEVKKKLDLIFINTEQKGEIIPIQDYANRITRV